MTVMGAGLRFAEIVNAIGKRLHIGCIMAAGVDWVEVSLPEHTKLKGDLRVRFLPSDVSHDVKLSWRSIDRVGFTYAAGGPPEEQFAGIPGLLDTRSAAQRAKSV